MTNDPHGLVVIRPARSQRERWGQLARAQGRALKHWIIETLDAEVSRAMNNFTVPADLSFADLRLGRDADGALLVSRDAVRRLARFNQLPVTFFLDDEANMSWLIGVWYARHLAAGGAPDPVADGLLADGLARERGAAGSVH